MNNIIRERKQKEYLELLAVLNRILNIEDKEIFEKETKKLGYKIGSFDSAGRYELYPEFETHTSQTIRTPSRSWPLSVWKHIKTKKYLKSLSEMITNELEEVILKNKLNEELPKKEGKLNTNKI